MIDTRVVKLFKNGSSQAVRLPADFRFEGKEVYATRDEATGDVILSARSSVDNWDNFFAMFPKITDCDDFLANRDMNVLITEKSIFEEDC